MSFSRFRSPTERRGNKKASVILRFLLETKTCLCFQTSQQSISQQLIQTLRIFTTIGRNLLKWLLIETMIKSISREISLLITPLLILDRSLLGKNLELFRSSLENQSFWGSTTYITQTGCKSAVTQTKSSTCKRVFRSLSTTNGNWLAWSRRTCSWCTFSSSWSQSASPFSLNLKKCTFFSFK